MHTPSNRTMKFATHRLIDTVWVLIYKVKDEGIEIVYHGDLTPFGIFTESKVPEFRIIEDEQRIVSHVDINGERFTVTNPRGIFGYKLLSEMQLCYALVSAMEL